MRGVTSCVGLLVIMYTNAVLTSWITVHIENHQKSVISCGIHLGLNNKKLKNGPVTL